MQHPFIWLVYVYPSTRTVERSCLKANWLSRYSSVRLQNRPLGLPHAVQIFLTLILLFDLISGAG
jgi:hypothetical protein